MDADQHRYKTQAPNLCPSVFICGFSTPNIPGAQRRRSLLKGLSAFGETPNIEQRTSNEGNSNSRTQRSATPSVASNSRTGGSAFCLSCRTHSPPHGCRVGDRRSAVEPQWRGPNRERKNAPRRGAGRFEGRAAQLPTLASSSLFATFTILNCSACMPGSARKDSLPK
jgi:hypothetical protein